MRSPTPHQVPTVVLVRVESVVPGRLGASHSYTNTLVRASVQRMGVASRQLYGLPGSVRAVHLLLAHDPGVGAGDLILVPPVLAGNPVDLAQGALWVNSIDGLVQWFTGGSIASLATIDGLYTTPVTVVAPGLSDIGGGLGNVLVVLGPAENSAELGLQFRVDAAESA